VRQLRPPRAVRKRWVSSVVSVGCSAGAESSPMNRLLHGARAAHAPGPLVGAAPVGAASAAMPHLRADLPPINAKRDSATAKSTSLPLSSGASRANG
jgi:hypothetical protein